LSLTNPKITADLESRDDDVIIELQSESLALLVEVSLDGADVIFSDNYINLPPGRRVQLSCPLPAGWTLTRVQEALKVFSVFDSYANPPT
jgi:beta-mannosidase